MIPYGRQSIDASDLAAVEKDLASDYLTSGPAVTDFEEGIADYVGAKFASFIHFCHRRTACRLRRN